MNSPELFVDLLTNARDALRDRAFCGLHPVAVGFGPDSRTAERPQCQDRSLAAPQETTAA